MLSSSDVIRSLVCVGYNVIITLGPCTITYFNKMFNRAHIYQVIKIVIMMKNYISTAIIIICLTLLGCVTPKGDTYSEQRASIKTMERETLNDLFKLKPIARQELNDAVGYAVFSNTGFHLILLSTGSGWGVAHNNMTGEDTYMKMYTAGLGLGLGAKDFHGIFIFSTVDAFENFVNNGWQAGAQADAIAKSGEKGGSAESAIDIASGVKLYQITRNGLALQATIQGTKYWKDEYLN